MPENSIIVYKVLWIGAIYTIAQTLPSVLAKKVVAIAWSQRAFIVVITITINKGE